jgi:hypothetical protein
LVGIERSAGPRVGKVGALNSAAVLSTRGRRSTAKCCGWFARRNETRVSLRTKYPYREDRHARGYESPSGEVSPAPHPHAVLDLLGAEAAREVLLTRSRRIDARVMHADNEAIRRCHHFHQQRLTEPSPSRLAAVDRFPREPEARDGAGHGQTSSILGQCGSAPEAAA